MSDPTVPGSQPPGGQLVIYQDGGLSLQVRLDGQTVWLTQRQMAELYQTTVPNINQHISSIYAENELRPEATIKHYLIVQTEGQREVSRTVEHYSLDVILAVGYLDFADLQARSQRPMHMAAWLAKLDAFLRLSDRGILAHAGKVSHQLAEEHAHAQFEQYAQRWRALEAAQDSSDFDQTVRRLTKEQGAAAKPARRKKKRKKKGSPGSDA